MSSFDTRVHKKISIPLELTGLVLISLLVAALFFWAANRFSGWYIERHYENSDYIQSRNRELAAKLQEYISENGLSVTDREELSQWVKKKNVISVRIFCDGWLIYDSGDPDSEEKWLSSEEEYDEWETVETLMFSDGYAYLVLYGNYAYQMANIALIVELILAFVLFFGGILLGLRKTLRYIRQLKQEIQLLEVGNLDYPITIRGRDELAELAEGLDAMRVSLKAQMEEETRVTSSHQRIITEMSHDLRTPLTSILLFAEIIQKEGAQDPEKTLNYVRKIDRKARQMKNLTEKIFAYSMAGAGSAEEAETQSASGCSSAAESPEADQAAGDFSAAATETNPAADVSAEPAATFKGIFYDILSEIGACLEQSGFGMEWSIAWSGGQIRADADYVGRIADNLVSNLLKYADPFGIVRIRTQEDAEFICLILENTVRQLQEKPESTGIGVPNIRKMMESMGGRCEITQTESLYRTALYFRKL